MSKIEVMEEIMSEHLYKISENATGITIEKYLGNECEIRIPDSISGKPVTRIAGEAFTDEEGFPLHIDLLSIPESVTYIDRGCFGIHQFNRKWTTVTVAPGSYAEKFMQEEMRDIPVLYYGEDVDTDSTSLHSMSYSVLGDGSKSVFVFSDGEQGSEHIRIPAMHLGVPVREFRLSISTLTGVKTITLPRTVRKIDFRDRPLPESFEQLIIHMDNPYLKTDGAAVYTKDGSTLLCMLKAVDEEYVVAEGTIIIGASAFKNSKLKKVILPDSVQRIEMEAFRFCSNLAEIHRIEHVSHIGNQALADTAYEKVTPMLRLGNILLKYQNGTETAVTVPEGIEEIGAECFRFTTHAPIKTITLPSTLKKIGAHAFYDQHSITGIQLPEGLETISDYAFRHCNGLKTLHIPASVSELPESAFPRVYRGSADKASFRRITVAEGNKNYCAVDGVLYTKDMTRLLYVPQNLPLSTLRVPESVVTIQPNACYFNNTLKHVILPASLRSIGKEAFYECAALETVEMAGGVMIGEYAFTNCGNLTRVVLPDTLKKICMGAFAGCYRLTSVELPDGVEYIENAAFGKCRLMHVVAPKTVRNIGNEAFSGCPDITIYDTLDPDAADCYSGIDVVNGEPTSETGFIGIGPSRARWQCAANHNWVDHVITVKSAETDAVKYKVYMESDPSQRAYYCLLTSAWGHNATFAFRELDAFFPKIKGSTYKLKVALSRLMYQTDLTDEARDSYKKYLSRAARDAVQYCIDQKDMDLLLICLDAGSVKASNVEDLISYSAARGNTSATAALLSYKEKCIPVKARKADAGLGRAPKASKEKAPVDKTSDAYLKKVWMVKETSSGQGYITRYKGEDTKLVFPTEVCGVKILGIAGRTGSAPDIYSQITSVVIPEGYIEIGNNAFSGCTALKTVELPTSVTLIGDKAFMGCTSLTSVVLPAALEAMGFSNNGHWMFRDCTALKDIYVLNPNLRISDPAAFRGCKNYMVHALPHSTIREYLKGKHFAPLTEDEKKMLAKKYFSIPAKRYVLCSKPKEDLPAPGDLLVLTLGNDIFNRQKIYADTLDGDVCGYLMTEYQSEFGITQSTDMSTTSLTDYLLAKVTGGPRLVMGGETAVDVEICFSEDVEDLIFQQE